MEKLARKYRAASLFLKNPFGYDSLSVRFFLKVGLEVLSMVEDGDPLFPLV